MTDIAPSSNNHPKSGLTIPRDQPSTASDGQGRKIHVVLPAYNEVGNISVVLQDVCNVLAKRNRRLIVVDDGSTDGSTQQIEEFVARQAESIKVIHHATNQGAPRTLFDGYREAISAADDDDCLICIEGDGTSDIGIMTTMIDRVDQNYDIVIAARYRSGGEIIGFPLTRRWISRLGNALLKAVFPHPQVTDFSIFYRAYRMEFVKKVFNDAKGENVFIGRHFDGNTTFLLRCLTYDPNICEVPQRYSYNRKKSLSSFRLIPIAIGLLRSLLSPSASAARAVCRKRRRLHINSLKLNK